MAGGCQPASTKTGRSHMSRGERNERGSGAPSSSMAPELKGQRSGVGPVGGAEWVAHRSLTLTQRRSGCLEFNHP